MKGYPGEAKVVLDEGIAAGAVDPKKSPFKEMIPQASPEVVRVKKLPSTPRLRRRWRAELPRVR